MTKSRRLTLSDALIVTIGERPMRLSDITRAIAKQGHGKALLQCVREEIDILRRKRIVAEIREGFISTRRCA